MTRFSFLAALALLSAPVHADDMTPKEAFVDANIRTIFYHELGHAVIDIMGVPIFGQEEDAADVMAVLLVDWLYDEDAAQAIAYDSAFGFISDPAGKNEIAYWDLHGPDEQRYYNHVCLFYGANPEERDDLATELGLPEERAEFCPDEYDQAAHSWGMIFDEIDEQKKGVPIVFQPGKGPHSEILNQILSEEVKGMNEALKFPEKLTVKVESCDEPNAFYDPRDVSVIMCTEFAEHLEELHEYFSATKVAD